MSEHDLERYMRIINVMPAGELDRNLDIFSRKRFFDYLTAECAKRAASVVYATHIFDGLESFMSHVAFVANGELKFCKKFEEIEGLREREPGSLLRVVEGWLRKEYKLQRERKALEKTKNKETGFIRNNGWAAGRTTSTVTFGPTLDQTRDHVGIKGSSNAVMRN